jgi:hypothetical protein
MQRVAEEMEFRRALPVVLGNVDYQEFRGRLEELNGLLSESGLEQEFVERGLRRQEEEGRREAQEQKRAYRALGWRDRVRAQRMLRQALRCNVARWLTEKEYRRFSRRLADSELLQWFCEVDRIEAIRVPSKSALERYDKLMPEPEVRELVNRLNRLAVEGKVGLEERLGLEAYFSDATCVKAAIHFPVDWVLLRDGVRTLMKAIRVIRRHGLKHRMEEPEGFLRQINRLAMEMAQSRRRPDSRKRRKQILRKMKRLNRVVMKHARRYRQKLAEDWSQQTDLKEGEVRQILKRIDGVLEQMPAAIHQAHERIIGERKVANAKKLLSLYDRELHVIVRGKAEAEVEFGNTLWLGEQVDGLILDWKLLKDRSPGDTKLFRESVERIHTVFGKYPRSAAGDRGLWSQGNENWLESRGVYSALCPRGVRELQERLKDKRFSGLQKRRAQTEGRIGILKNDFLGRPLRSKGFEHRELAAAWAVLVHNLWLLAGRRMAQEEEEKKAA